CIFFFFIFLRLQISTLFPYTTLFRSLECGGVGGGLGGLGVAGGVVGGGVEAVVAVDGLAVAGRDCVIEAGAAVGVGVREGEAALDRKSTRLNSSHVEISYAVFCLKKK